MSNHVYINPVDEPGGEKGRETLLFIRQVLQDGGETSSQQLHTVYFFFFARRDSAPKSRRNDGTRASDGASPHLVILACHGISEYLQ